MFVIEDSCGGIPLEEAERYVFRFGNNDDHLKSYSSIGFGVGMKSANVKKKYKFVDFQINKLESDLNERNLRNGSKHLENLHQLKSSEIFKDI